MHRQLLLLNSIVKMRKQVEVTHTHKFAFVHIHMCTLKAFVAAVRRNSGCIHSFIGVLRVVDAND